MIEQVKWYFAKVVLPKYVPVAVLSAIGYVVTFMLSHASILEQYGITTGQWPLKMDYPSGMVTLIEWATLGTKTGAALTVIAGVAIAAAQHHMTGTPTVQGGQRASDPPAAEPPKVV